MHPLRGESTYKRQKIAAKSKCKQSADLANVKGALTMLDLGENLRRLILAGVGVAAVTKEKGADVLNELVKKGELTIEQGKVLNEELKHNIKDAIRENVTIVTPPDDVISAVDSLSDEQLEALKAHIAAREATKKTASSAASDEPASGAPASGDSASDETTEN